MTSVHLVVGVMSIALTGAAGFWGAWCWYRLRASRLFWLLLRAGQVVVVLQAALGGVLVLQGRRDSSLHLLYGLLPLGVSFVAEQLRIASAQMVLDQRGFESPEEVGRLPGDEQRTVVVRILQREIGVMVIAALVMFVLLIRAAGTAP